MFVSDPLHRMLLVPRQDWNIVLFQQKIGLSQRSEHSVNWAGDGGTWDFGDSMGAYLVGSKASTICGCVQQMLADSDEYTTTRVHFKEEKDSN